MKEVLGPEVKTERISESTREKLKSRELFKRILFGTVQGKQFREFSELVDCNQAFIIQKGILPQIPQKMRHPAANHAQKLKEQFFDETSNGFEFAMDIDNLFLPIPWAGIKYLLSVQPMGGKCIEDYALIIKKENKKLEKAGITDAEFFMPGASAVCELFFENNLLRQAISKHRRSSVILTGSNLFGDHHAIIQILQGSVALGRYEKGLLPHDLSLIRVLRPKSSQ